jgi:hypothetical protein
MPPLNRQGQAKTVEGPLVPVGVCYTPDGQNYTHRAIPGFVGALRARPVSVCPTLPEQVPVCPGGNAGRAPYEDADHGLSDAINRD